MRKRKNSVRAADQRTIFQVLNTEDPKLKRIKKTIETNTQTTNKAPIVIPYRKDGNGKGAHFDHLSFQILTNMETQIAYEESTSPRSFSDYLSNQTHALKYGEMNQFGNIIPKIFDLGSHLNNGLLVIPGTMRSDFDKKTPDYITRKQHQNALIKEASLRGQPVIALCGGAWELFGYFGGGLVDVKDHNYGGGMPRIKDTTGKIGNNKQLHRIQLLNKAYILKGAMQYENYKHVNPYPPVNSVHWKAPSPENFPKNFVVSAVSKKDDELAPVGRNKKKMQPEQCIEAFESAHGAPMLGILWHSEAYTANTESKFFPQQHKQLLFYMALAGVSYMLKQNMLEELKKNSPKLKSGPKLFLIRRNGKDDYLLHVDEFNRFKKIKKLEISDTLKESIKKQSQAVIKPRKKYRTRKKKFFDNKENLQSSLINYFGPLIVTHAEGTIAFKEPFKRKVLEIEEETKENQKLAETLEIFREKKEIYPAALGFSNPINFQTTFDLGYDNEEIESASLINKENTTTASSSIIPVLPKVINTNTLWQWQQQQEPAEITTLLAQVRAEPRNNQIGLFFTENHLFLLKQCQEELFKVGIGNIAMKGKAVRKPKKVDDSYVLYLTIDEYNAVMGEQAAEQLLRNSTNNNNNNNLI